MKLNVIILLLTLFCSRGDSFYSITYRMSEVEAFHVRVIEVEVFLVCVNIYKQVYDKDKQNKSVNIMTEVFIVFFLFIIFFLFMKFESNFSLLLLTILSVICINIKVICTVCCLLNASFIHC